MPSGNYDYFYKQYQPYSISHTKALKPQNDDSSDSEFEDLKAKRLTPQTVYPGSRV